MNDDQDWRPEDDMLTGIVLYFLVGLGWLLFALLEPYICWFFSFCQ